MSTQEGSSPVSRLISLCEAFDGVVGTPWTGTGNECASRIAGQVAAEADRLCGLLAEDSQALPDLQWITRDAGRLRDELAPVDSDLFPGGIHTVSPEIAQKARSLTAVAKATASIWPAGKNLRGDKAGGRPRGGSDRKYDHDKDAKLKQDWLAARSNGSTIKDFATERGMSHTEVKRAIDRARKTRK